jgi:uncharacterized FAD-dependent dehydrogenase
MKKIVILSLPPQEAADSSKYKNQLSEKINIVEDEIFAYKLLKRSIDARQKQIVIHHTFEVYINEKPSSEKKYNINYRNVSGSKQVIIVGAGPAGLFAALRLIELGIKPVIIDRGKKVEDRRFDIAAINKKRIIDPDSNYCFGEGGAGTYSDGKLYTRSTKRGDVNKILHIFHEHGASEDILIDSHPHIGTDKLPNIIAGLRNTILNNGGEIHFGKRITDIIIQNGRAKGVITNDKAKFEGEAVILATGHSARDIYEMLNNNKILIESKPFAVGVRIEHSQQHIDSIQYHSIIKDTYLPPAIYGLACQSEGKGVFSFCMCPGGTIVTASTSPEELVLNGMSNSQRNQPFANSGIVVTVDEKDFPEYKEFGTLAGLKFQETLERNAFVAGGTDYSAPAQCMNDFLENKISATLNETSYFPGIKSVPLHELLPSFITSRLQEAFSIFDKKMKGFITNEANLLGIETRTSSPVRIPRNNETLEHLQISDLYPCGEGSGYAGGIISSAIDGERCAESAAKKILG